jgi:hypothetical protein
MVPILMIYLSKASFSNPESLVSLIFNGRLHPKAYRVTFGLNAQRYNKRSLVKHTDSDREQYDIR